MAILYAVVAIPVVAEAMNIAWSLDLFWWLK